MTTILDQARAFADGGDVNAALIAYKKVLETESNNPDLLEEVGFLEVQAGHFAEAIGLMKLALDFRPNDPTSHLNLAEAYNLSGSAEPAREHYQRVIQLNPKDADAYFGLARLCIESKQWEMANTHLKSALEHAPNDIEILHLNASTLVQAKDWKGAEKTYLKIVSLQPKHFDAIVDLARFYYDRNRFPKAIKRYYAAETLSPLPSEDLLNFTQALIAEGRAKDAIAITHKLMMSSSLPALALARRGQLLSTLGMFDEAERDMRTAIQSNRQASGPYEQLGSIHRLTDQDIRQLEKLVQGPSVQKDTLVGYWFALFNGYKDRKEHEKSFDALKKACDFRLEDNPIDIKDIMGRSQETRDIFDLEFFERRKSLGYEKPGPIFIVGMPRSGTTLTERVLAAHPDVVGRGECYSVSNLADDIEGYPKSIVDISKDWAVTQGRLLHQEILPPESKERFAADKMPGNFTMVGLISLVLPNAKVIWCKRNPIDNCLSCYEQHFTEGWNFTYSLEGLGVAYRQHEKTMHHWMDVCPIPVHTVHYEELVSEPEKTARAMLDYVGLEWDPRCLNPEQVENNIVTASMWQARQPIYTGSVEKWRKYEKQLQPLIKALEEN
ncbi:MAG: tetratricopeptide repeat protein [Alphaproteobacteria bacterium]|nr:tetratricopeptide repeat protein [Alphaproteobacteria bacterium]